MKRNDLTVIDVTRATLAISRAGREAGITGVSKLCNVTPERSRRCLGLALKLRLVYAYSNEYRSNVKRVCYAITPTGMTVLETIDDSDQFMLWEKSSE